MAYIILFFYLLALLFIFLFSLAQLHLTWYYKRASKKKTQGKQEVLKLEPLPLVTIQLPVYNEVYVVERLIDAVCAFRYPKDKMEIQVLDDSTDETSVLISEKVKSYKAKSFQIAHIQRKNREGFKAGALQRGLSKASGTFIAIFDADFIPQADFLTAVLPEFQDPQLGMVQTRWGHLNKDYSLLTQLQAFGLNAHFSVEQVGRSQAGSFINFNGTGGIWRKSCILDAGGWSADTLTEDLDLSYRAQLRGWKFRYLQEIEAPAELPILMPAIKSQQYRWNKGAAETAKKHFLKIFSSDLSFKNRFHAFFHLFNSTVFIAILVSAILSIPILFIKHQYPELNIAFYLSSIFFLGFLAIAHFYWVANKSFLGKGATFQYLKVFPMFLIISMGLSLYNSIAVLEGFCGRKTPFVRTPKFNILSGRSGLSTKKYRQKGISFITLAEGLLVFYFLFGAWSGFRLHDYGLVLFHLMLATGFGLVFYYSIKSIFHAE